MDRIVLECFPASELTWRFSPNARRRLLAANKGFDAESRIAELELWVALTLKTDRSSRKACRARAARLIQLADQLPAALTDLGRPFDSRQIFWNAMNRAGMAPDWRNQFEHTFGAIAFAAREVRHAIPGRGGRAPLALRDGLILWTCGWVDRLSPLRARAAVRGALARDAEQDALHLPLIAPKDNLTRRRLESVKIIFGEAGLRIDADLPAIIRKVLGKKSPSN